MTTSSFITLSAILVLAAVLTVCTGHVPNFHLPAINLANLKYIERRILHLAPDATGCVLPTET